MKEIEVKILDIDVFSIRRKLLSLGAVKEFEGSLPTVVFDTPDSRLHHSGTFLRLRKEGNRVLLTFKGKNESGTFKIKDELEVVVDDFDKTAKLLGYLGFVRKFEYGKHREEYRLGAVKFCLDTYEGVPTYLEIEAPSEQEVERAVIALGYEMDQTTNISASELLANNL